MYFLIGFFIWTLFEYLTHRFLFHSKFKSLSLIELQEYFHGLHHTFPRATEYLTWPYYLGFLILSLIIFSIQIGSGFYLGFIIYEYVHHEIHHKNFKNYIFKKLKEHHYYHHYKDNTKNFAVILPLWDYIFLTKHR